MCCWWPGVCQRLVWLFLPAAKCFYSEGEHFIVSRTNLSAAEKAEAWMRSLQQLLCIDTSLCLFQSRRRHAERPNEHNWHFAVTVTVLCAAHWYYTPGRLGRFNVLTCHQSCWPNHIFSDECSYYFFLSAACVCFFSGQQWIQIFQLLLGELRAVCRVFSEMKKCVWRVASWKIAQSARGGVGVLVMCARHHLIWDWRRSVSLSVAPVRVCVCVYPHPYLWQIVISRQTDAFPSVSLGADWGEAWGCVWVCECEAEGGKRSIWISLFNIRPPHSEFVFFFMSCAFLSSSRLVTSWARAPALLFLLF